MSFCDILIIAVGLAMDAFAVSLGAGTQGFARGFRPVFRLSFHFGLFQFLMPLLGWYLGTQVAGYIRSFDHWIAFGLLAFVGIRMIVAGGDDRKDAPKANPTRGITLVSLSVATSIDALAVGLSLAMLEVNIWYPSVVIGVVTAGLSVVGIRLGHRLAGRFGQRMEIAGGVLLLLIGLRIVASHWGE
jgi:manganese efflux pump family protein